MNISEYITRLHVFYESNDHEMDDLFLIRHGLDFKRNLFHCRISV